MSGGPCIFSSTLQIKQLSPTQELAQGKVLEDTQARVQAKQALALRVVPSTLKSPSEASREEQESCGRKNRLSGGTEVDGARCVLERVGRALWPRGAK